MARPATKLVIGYAHAVDVIAASLLQLAPGDIVGRGADVDVTPRRDRRVTGLPGAHGLRTPSGVLAVEVHHRSGRGVLSCRHNKSRAAHSKIQLSADASNE